MSRPRHRYVALVSLGAAATVLLGMTATAGPSSARKATTDAATSAVVTIAVGGRPTAAALSPDGSTAYVSNAATGTIDVIDLTGREFNGSIPIGGAITAPVVSSTGSRIFTTSITDGQVVAVDPSARSVVARIKVGARPQAPVVSKDGGTLFVANTGSDSLSIVSIADAEVTATIRVGDRPLAPVQGTGDQYDSFTDRLFVTNAGSNSLMTVDLKKARVVDERLIGPDPSRPAVSPAMGVISDRVAVANFAADAVSIMSQSDEESSVTVRVGRGPASVVSAIDGTALFVSNTGSDSVSVLDLQASPVRVTATIPVGDGPSTPLLGPSGRVLFVPNSQGSTVSIIDTNTRSLRGSYQVGRGPSGLALSSDATTLIVPNADDGTVSVIDLTQSVLPFPPVSVTVDPVPGRARIAWQASNQAGVTGYVVTALPGGRSCTTSRTACTITGLTAGNRYRFMVQSTNAFGSGAATVTPRTRVPKR